MANQLAMLGIAPAPTKKGDSVIRDAYFSPCGTWRYWLSRMFAGSDGPVGLVVMVNPSTADNKTDDPTIQSLIRRARIWGWGGFYVVNMAAFCSSHPDDLLVPARSPDPVGPENDATIARLAAQVAAGGGKFVAAWGASVDFSDPHGRPELRGRVAGVLGALTALGEVLCLGRSGNGSPTHPLARGKHRVPDDAPLEVYAARAGQPRASKKTRSPFAVDPPSLRDRPRVGIAPVGACEGCGGVTEGRYSVQVPSASGLRSVPLCNTCGVSEKPTIWDIRKRVAAQEATDAELQATAD